MANQIVQRCIEKGINYFDTEAYSKGDSEKQLGVAIKQLQEDLREQVVIGTKCLPENTKEIKKHCEESLKRLGIEQIELYIVHVAKTASS